MPAAGGCKPHALVRLRLSVLATWRTGGCRKPCQYHTGTNSSERSTAKHTSPPHLCQLHSLGWALGGHRWQRIVQVIAAQ